MRHNTHVPAFQQYFASEENMDSPQSDFYKAWEKAWNKGEALNVNGNISYLFCYCYKILSLNPIEAIPQLHRLKNSYFEEKRFPEYCNRWISDCHVLLEDFKQAIEIYPIIPISSRSMGATDSLLSLRLQCSDHVKAGDILTLNGPRVTAWGKNHLDKVVSYIEVFLRSYEQYNLINLLENWKSLTEQYPYQVFVGTVMCKSALIPCYSFSTNENVIQFINDLTRDAENSVREEMNIPRVGEGWIGETELYYALKSALSEVKVEFHARPSWLKNQHLDIYIPSFRVGLEFQGLQHDVPVDYFGGETGYNEIKRRDAKKRIACLKNGVKLIEVRPGYCLVNLVRDIHDLKS